MTTRVNMKLSGATRREVTRLSVLRHQFVLKVQAGCQNLPDFA
jgi:hypothetical protein